MIAQQPHRNVTLVACLATMLVNVSPSVPPGVALMLIARGAVAQQCEVPGLIVEPFAGEAAGRPALSGPKFGLIDAPGGPYRGLMYISELGGREVVSIRSDGLEEPFTRIPSGPTPAATYGIDIDGPLANLPAPTLGLYGFPFLAPPRFAISHGGAEPGLPLLCAPPLGPGWMTWFAGPTGPAQLQFDRTPGHAFGGYMYVSEWGNDENDGILRYLPSGERSMFCPMPNTDPRYFTFDIGLGGSLVCGGLWVSSYSTGRVYCVVLDPSGTSGAALARAQLSPGIEGLAFGPGVDLFTRDLYVANLPLGTVHTISAEGTVRLFMSGLPGAAYLMFVDAGPYRYRGNPTLYIADGVRSVWRVYHCLADVDNGAGNGTPDGGVTIDDLLYYLYIFEVGEISADIDDGSGTGTRDGGVTIDDLLYYLVRFEAGC